MFLFFLLSAILPVRAGTILILGDSLSAAYGIDPEKGWVALLAEALREEGFCAWRVVNASRSGETSFGARRRLPKLLDRYRPEIVVLELGGNDGLRGFPPAAIEANLEAMIGMVQARRSRVVLVEIDLPRNYGRSYRESFKALFRRLAVRRRVLFVPSWLMPEILEPGMRQPDGIHPTEKLQPILFAKIWRLLKPLLGRSDGLCAQPDSRESAPHGRSPRGALSGDAERGGGADGRHRSDVGPGGRPPRDSGRGDRAVSQGPRSDPPRDRGAPAPGKPPL